MAATPLSRKWTWKRLYGRIAMRLGQVKDYTMEEESVLQIALASLDNLFINSPSFKQKFLKRGTFAVATDSAGKYIDIGAGNDYVCEITDVGYSTATPGGSHPYIMAANSTELINYNVFWNPEALKTGRKYFVEWGADSVQIRLATGSSVSGEDSLTVWYIRFPDTAITMDDIKTGTKMVDLPDELMEYLISKTVSTALSEKNLTVPQTDIDTMQNLAALDSKILQVNTAEKAAKMNTVVQ